MTACGTDAGLAAATHRKLRKGKLRQGGKPVGLHPTEGLGVLVPAISFLRHTASAFSSKLSPLNFEKAYRRWIAYEKKRALGQRVTQSEIGAAFIFHKASVPARQDGEIWLFQNPWRKTNAFDGVLDEWLAARLGLDVRPGECRLTFSFAAAHVENQAKPRFLDAHWDLSKWHWCGKTRPLPGTPKTHDGLQELVADPPYLRDLNQPVLAMSFRVP
ncbi:MAG: hypothetical protein A3H27_05665 [Acidobacteria bacterium RIFCSPLOWO2_02_FULL_59_13]|nr:MAG: hypothetical protein A3H27_05665 [Acidobacteria bacterium RIFCSPLOWO2_02_FULL_59_13]